MSVPARPTRGRGAFSGNRRASDRSRPYQTAPAGSWKQDIVTRQNSAAAAIQGAAPVADRIVVSNLHYEVTAQDLAAIFQTIGPLAREPTIRYDRSGRSLGVAQVTFASAGHASLARNRLDGALAKGQPMSISLDKPTTTATTTTNGLNGIPTGPRANSLLNRVAKPPLLERLTGPSPTNQPRALANAATDPPPRAPRATLRTAALRASGQSTRGRGGGRGGKAPREKPKPKTAEDLDAELQAYLAEDQSAGVPISAEQAAQSSGGDASVAADDIEMA